MSTTESLFNSIREGNSAKVADILSADSSLLEVRDTRGSTPLILATYYNQIEISKILLEKGTDLNSKDSSGNTALMGVCFKGYIDI